MAWRSSPYPVQGGGGSATDTLLVAPLPGYLSQADVNEIFGAYGSLSTCKVQQGGPGKASALIQWISVEEASRIRELLNGNIAHGLTDPLHITFAPPLGGGGDGGKGGDGKGDGKGKGAYYSNRTPMTTIVRGFEDSGGLPGGRSFTNDEGAVFVGGLSPDCSDLDLYRIFAPFGAIAPRGVKAMLEEDRLTCKGYGFVNFLYSESAQAAIQTLHGTVLPDGNSLKVHIKRNNSAQKTPLNSSPLI
mmetsp:Transcript_2120/g.5374  ORF Transcript_2120/g.5374 Transcript_2120/m.5374 type:complete len:246 (+) Transcript_2120:102-839(+)